MNHEIIGIRHLTKNTFVLRFSRNGLKFQPGQHILAGIDGKNAFREYSIYSAERDPFLEILVKEVENGLLSKSLKLLRPGDHLNVEGPMGFFGFDQSELNHKRCCFIATGTGIAPFHSMVKTHPSVNYKIIHGVRYGNEQYEKENYDPSRYFSCLSADTIGSFHGRITGYLKLNPPDPDAIYYLCGNCNMIHEVYDVLISSGIARDCIHTEVYF